MNKNRAKKKWGKPKLIVLVKGRMDETILAGCKYGDGGGFTGSLLSGCGGKNSNCEYCSAASSS